MIGNSLVNVVYSYTKHLQNKDDNIQKQSTEMVGQTNIRCKTAQIHDTV